MIHAGESAVTQAHSCYKAASPASTVSQNAVSKANESGGVSVHIMPAELHVFAYAVTDAMCVCQFLNTFFVSDLHHIYTFLLASICVLLWLCDKLLHGAFRWPMCRSLCVSVFNYNSFIFILMQHVQHPGTYLFEFNYILMALCWTFAICTTWGFVMEYYCIFALIYSIIGLMCFSSSVYCCSVTVIKSHI